MKSKRATAKRELSEKQKAVLRANAFKPGESGNKGNSNGTIKRTQECNGLFEKFRVMPVARLRKFDIEKLPVQEGVIIKRLLAAIDREGSARTEVWERLLGKVPQPLSGDPDNPIHVNGIWNVFLSNPEDGGGHE